MALRYIIAAAMLLMAEIRHTTAPYAIKFADGELSNLSPAAAAIFITLFLMPPCFCHYALCCRFSVASIIEYAAMRHIICCRHTLSYAYLLLFDFLLMLTLLTLHADYADTLTLHTLHADIAIVVFAPALLLLRHCCCRRYFHDFAIFQMPACRCCRCCRYMLIFAYAIIFLAFSFRHVFFAAAAFLSFRRLITFADADAAACFRLPPRCCYFA